MSFHESLDTTSKHTPGDSYTPFLSSYSYRSLHSQQSVHSWTQLLEEPIVEVWVLLVLLSSVTSALAGVH